VKLTITHPIAHPGYRFNSARKIDPGVFSSVEQVEVVMPAFIY
jgi:hypothetical protein